MQEQCRGSKEEPLLGLMVWLQGFQCKFHSLYHSYSKPLQERAVIIRFSSQNPRLPVEPLDNPYNPCSYHFSHYPNITKGTPHAPPQVLHAFRLEAQKSKAQHREVGIDQFGEWGG